MTREELKRHCEKQVENCEKWAKCIGEEPHGKVYEEHKLILELLEQEPCEDAISREDVLEITNEWLNNQSDDNIKTQFDLKLALTNLPLVYPKAKVGKWVTWSEEIKCDGYTEYRTRCKCSECNTEYDGYFTHFIKYCPNCGAKMVEPQESEVEK